MGLSLAFETAEAARRMLDGFFPERVVLTVVALWALLVSVPLVRALTKVALRLSGRRGVERVLVVGRSPLAERIVAEIGARPHLRQHVVGIVDESSGPTPSGCIGSAPDLRRIVDEVRPRRVIVALASRRGRMPLRALLDLRIRGILVEDGVDVYERLTGKIAIEALTPTSVIFCKDFRPGRVGLALVRGLSQPFVAAALIALAPVLALVAVAIKLDSPGPIFFVQDRVGRYGRRFKLVKFRTMRPAPGATSEWERDNGDRLTRVGRWLRRFRLDELPQLINILKGDMNLVGPRPHPVTNLPLLVLVMRNTPSCGEPIPFYALRWMVRPGLTGWAQVRYRYANDLEEEVEKMRHDLYYIKHMSLWLDLRILVQTFRTILRGHASAAAKVRGAAAAVAAGPMAGRMLSGEPQGELP